MAFSFFRQVFGDLETATEEEKREQGKRFVWIMFVVAILGIIATLLIPHFFYRN